MMDWQDIETAPKTDDFHSIVIWREGWREPRIGFWRGTRWGYYGNIGVRAEKANQPTHWQPLPEPPNA